jgi:hypothetical protein
MEAVIVAVIAGVFGILVALIEKGRRENKRDHGNVMDRLDLISSEIRSDIRQVRGEISDHANGPAHGGTAKPAKMPRKRGPKAG